MAKPLDESSMELIYTYLVKQCAISLNGIFVSSYSNIADCIDIKVDKVWRYTSYLQARGKISTFNTDKCKPTLFAIGERNLGEKDYYQNDQIEKITNKVGTNVDLVNEINQLKKELSKFVRVYSDNHIDVYIKNKDV